ncbi:MAG: hypothetical protein ACI8Q1_001349 [Parvicella sp.]|jgi:hypothetical protein
MTLKHYSETEKGHWEAEKGHWEIDSLKFHL